MSTIRACAMIFILAVNASAMKNLLMLRVHQFAKSSRAGPRVVRSFASVTGIVYEDYLETSPRIKLFTKGGCTLCDKVKEVLSDVRSTHGHSLEQIDITDEDHRCWFDRYKYDIPVLHIEHMYWTKHRLTGKDAMEAIESWRSGQFESPRGEPNASAMER